MGSTQEVVFLLAISETRYKVRVFSVVSLSPAAQEGAPRRLTQFQPLPVPGRPPVLLWGSMPLALNQPHCKSWFWALFWNISPSPFLTLGSRSKLIFRGMDSILSVTPKHQFVALSTILELPEGMPSVSWLLPFVSWQLSSCQFSPGVKSLRKNFPNSPIIRDR